MDRGWYVRFTFFVACVIAAWFALWPSLAEWNWLGAPDWVTDNIRQRIAQGLDIRGGMRLEYDVEVERAVEDRRDLRATQMHERLCQRFEICSEDEPATREQLEQTRERARVESIRGEATQFRVIFESAEDLGQLDHDMVSGFGDLREIARSTTSVTLELRQESVDQLREQSIEQARTTVSERIDEMGLREAAVMSREERIVVELPGATEEAFTEVREIIGRTARLEFKIVDDENAGEFIRGLDDVPEGITTESESVSAGESHPTVVARFLQATGENARELLTEYVRTLDQAGRIPEDHQLAISQADIDADEDGVMEEAWRTYYLFRRADVTGDSVSDASVAFDPQDNSPFVQLLFNSAGARAFERLTGANVRRRMAIVLDDRVASAPVIQTRIGGGHCRITLGNFARPMDEVLDEANDLVVVLRAGALPAPLTPGNQQLIGPTLGADSVQQGIFGAMMGILLVLIFMGVYYEVGGIVANVMVLFNLFFLLSLLAAFEATLTLPGIAGIALTVGMAVDANVLINERIRDEQRLGKGVRAAVESGFDKAFSSIFDSQLTTFLAAVVLYQFGTGPIRGFAVTLVFGIITSLFTGVFCSKLMFDWIVRGLKVQRLRVG